MATPVKPKFLIKAYEVSLLKQILRDFELSEGNDYPPIQLILIEDEDGTGDEFEDDELTTSLIVTYGSDDESSDESSDE